MTATTAARSVAADRLDLLDWKRRIFDVYRDVRNERDPIVAWSRWREVRGELIGRHPQSPLDESRRPGFEPVYFDYDPEARVLADVVALEAEQAEIPMSRDDGTRFTRFANASFELQGEQLALGLYWLDAYGGGIFLSFMDETSGATTYGAGRYVLDTVKGADLGMSGKRLVLDFNFAFNPSCAYDPRWACPLAPPENRLPVAVRAGERRPELT